MKVTDEMVNRFLAWKLPENFCPDAGISFKPTFNEHTAYPMRHEPIGTNLFDADQTRAMLEHVLATSSEITSREDAGTVKLLTDLLDRAYKMHVMAGTTTRISEQDADQNDPLLAWLSDVRSVLYGKTKKEPAL